LGEDIGQDGDQATDGTSGMATGNFISYLSNGVRVIPLTYQSEVISQRLREVAQPKGRAKPFTPWIDAQSQQRYIGKGSI